MAQKQNSLTTDVQQVHKALSLANFAASSADASARRETEGVKRLLKGKNGNALITMAALPGCDVYEDQPKYISYGAC